ncbi:DnaB-like helicase C-terminal domain-containing protein [Tepidibacter formicigenes]|jgi:replicative DNA helicase|uniref:DnaB-like helicase C terminal domain-containing protein n=1 Tax=Tepidibacter formicigenes DSM 15518 TaxID=1123349 RepID=A0A1M6N0H0_9FIRM|nr:DnaB-like helicase C-terminal domain-containing protein [Tepidibacter formicigenes]SHJ89184.1 DnaB-like helicase C terminal domain-containing protein [Tepidibacter formicigenes DSM 15518]
MARRLKNNYNSIESEIDNFFKNMQENKVISTGINNFDQILNGGILNGLYVIGSMPSFGKTDFINQIADNIAKQGYDILFFSYQMRREELILRSLCRKIFLLNPKKNRNIETINIMRKECDENLMKQGLEYYKKNISKTMFIIEGDFKTGVKEIKDKVERHIRLRQKKPVVIIDYLQAIKPLDFKMSDKQKNDYNLLELKKIVKDFNIPILCLSSQSRDRYLKQAYYDSFKDTGNIEDVADIAVYLQFKNLAEQFRSGTEVEKIRKAYELKNQYPRKLELLLLKNRNGLDHNIDYLYYYYKNNYFSSDRIKEGI